jgi:hypothetical protein
MLSPMAFERANINVSNDNYDTIDIVLTNMNISTKNLELVIKFWDDNSSIFFWDSKVNEHKIMLSFSPENHPSEPYNDTSFRNGLDLSIVEILLIFSTDISSGTPNINLIRLLIDVQKVFLSDKDFKYVEVHLFAFQTKNELADHHILYKKLEEASEDMH